MGHMTRDLRTHAQKKKKMNLIDAVYETAQLGKLFLRISLR